MLWFAQDWIVIIFINNTQLIKLINTQHILTIEKVKVFEAVSCHRIDSRR